MKITLVIFFINTAAWALNHEHSKFAEVLAKNLSKKGNQALVNYHAIKEDSSSLKSYIQELADVKRSEYESWSKENKMATLINGYNAWTIKLVIDHYPVSSIKNIGSFFSSPWKKKNIKWLGEERSLDDIEHGIIRKEFKDPRIHFALVCAAMGCPNLQKRPFIGESIDSQLKITSDEFLNDRSKNRFNILKDKVVMEVSSIFKWYGEDFGTREDLVSYLAEGMGIKDKMTGKKIRIEYLDYDWSLNDAR